MTIRIIFLGLPAFLLVKLLLMINLSGFGKTLKRFEQKGLPILLWAVGSGGFGQLSLHKYKTLYVFIQRRKKLNRFNWLRKV